MSHGSRNSLTVFWWLAGILLSFTIVLSISAPESFARFFGSFHPVLVCALVYVIGGTSLWFLNSVVGFSTFDKNKAAKGAASAAIAALLFGGIVVAIDVIVPFPQDLNVPFPASLLFYPVIALVVESLFHLAPLAGLYFLRDRLVNGIEGQKNIPLLIAAVALLEPFFQFSLMTSVAGFSAITLIVCGHILAINLTQLYLFVRFDFVSMFAFRIFYYLVWHIVWGYVRLL